MPLRGQTKSIVFPSEWNLAITDDAHCNHCFYISSGGERKRLCRIDGIPNTSRLLISDMHIGIDMSLDVDKPDRRWRYPVECVTNSEDGSSLHSREAATSSAGMLQ